MRDLSLDTLFAYLRLHLRRRVFETLFCTRRFGADLTNVAGDVVFSVS
jgi:hypothetical protein